MERPAEDPVALCLGRLLRHPEPLRDIELERALVRLQAARPDAAYLLLHRVLVLETALQALSPSTADRPAATASSVPASTLPSARSTRSFVRDAAAVAAGVVAGQVLWQALDDSPATGEAEGPDFGFEL